MIEVFDNQGETADRYTVRIGSSIYGMSDNATSPNGFNQYRGEADDLPNWRRGLPLMSPFDVPAVVRAAILERAWVVERDPEDEPADP